jgi:hypothetical protein
LPAGAGALKSEIEFLRLNSEKQKTTELIQAIEPGARVLLNPSSCPYFSDAESLPFDRVLFVSLGHQTTSSSGKVLCLKADNNFVLGVLAATRRRVAELSLSVLHALL